MRHYRAREERAEHRKGHGLALELPNNSALQPKIDPSGESLNEFSQHLSPFIRARQPQFPERKQSRQHFGKEAPIRREECFQLGCERCAGSRAVGQCGQKLGDRLRLERFAQQQLATPKSPKERRRRYPESQSDLLERNSPLRRKRDPARCFENLTIGDLPWSCHWLISVRALTYEKCGVKPRGCLSFQPRENPLSKPSIPLRGSMAPAYFELFHRIGDEDSARVRSVIAVSGLTDEVRFRNVAYSEVVADLEARGGAVVPSLWHGGARYEGVEKIIEALEVHKGAKTNSR